jgi:hypothetical protein
MVHARRNVNREGKHPLACPADSVPVSFISAGTEFAGQATAELSNSIRPSLR